MQARVTQASASASASASGRLHKAAILQWVLTFLLFGPVSLVVLLLLFRSSWWMLSAAYGVWYYWDREACRRGGRRSECVRRWRVWRLMAEYFPARLHKTCELDSSENFVLGFHPHGVLSVGAFIHFASEATGFSNIFPGIRPFLSVLDGHFDFPIYREYLMCSGAISVKKDSLQFVLSRLGKGQLVCVLPGGAGEALDSRPGSAYKIHLREKRGFVKLAMMTGSHLVPCISFGEINLYNQLANPTGSLLRTVQNALMRVLGFSMPVFSGNGLLPLPAAINTVVGAPIRVERNPDPSNEEVECLLDRYISDLKLLFDTHKTKYAGVEATIEII